MVIEGVIDSASEYVRQLLANELSSGFHFHHIVHTEYVVNACQEIGLNSQLTTQELQTLTLAAWFHDTGYTLNYTGHELASITIAKQFLAQYPIPTHQLMAIEACIKATQYPQQPTNLVEMVICDADFYHFSAPNYIDFAENLKKEWEEKLALYYNSQQWNTVNLNLLKNHSYFTPYGQKILQSKKEENIKALTYLLE